MSKEYNALARIYSHLMKSVDYGFWARYIRDIINMESRLESPGILEVASGNLALARKLRAYYGNIVATDLSLQMLERSSAANIQRVCCDMRALPFKKEFDVVLCAFDSINYLLDVCDLSRAFNEVFNVLKAGGLFLFDASLENNSLSCLESLNRTGSFRGIRYVQKSSYDRLERIHYNEFEIRLPGGHRFREVHKERIYSLETLKETLTGTGFILKNCYENFSLKDATTQSQRAQFVLIKGVPSAQL